MNEKTRQKIKDMQKNIQPLNMNGLHGRMLRLPAKKKNQRNIMMVYGHHASLERVYGIAEALNDYGTITVPDLPGFGGMESFYKLGIKPDLDAMADYLASFVKLRYRNKKITIVGMSLGFVIATRMLQRYPELVKKVDLLVSIVGFAHRYDLVFTKPRYYFYKTLASIFKRRLPAALFYRIGLRPSIIRLAYGRMYNAKKKLSGLSEVDKKAAIEFEIGLWRNNEVRTYMEMTLTMLNLDNCQQQLPIPVHHVSVTGDRFFDHTVVEQHMRVIFTGFTEHAAVVGNHAPSILATKEDAKPFIPDSFRRLLRKA